MPEVIRKKRTCKLMPGIDKITGDLKAYNMQSTIIAGTREDTDDILNSLLCHLVMFNDPNYLAVEYYSHCNGLDIWGGTLTSIPHFRTQIYAQNVDAIWDRLEQILLFCHSKIEGVELNYFSKSNMVIVLNELDKLLGNDRLIAKRRIELLKALLEVGEVIGLTLIVVVNQDNDLYDNFINWFTLRLAGSISAEWSDNLFGYNIAKETESYSKSVWAMCNQKYLTIEKLKLNYYHETLLKGIGKMYGMSYPVDYWYGIFNQKPFKDMSHTHIHLLLKRLFKTVIDTGSMTTQQLEDIFIYASSHIDSVRNGFLTYDDIKERLLKDIEV